MRPAEPKRFQLAKPDAAGLTRLFSEQQDNIKAALPRGLSLADFDTTSASPRRAEETRGVHRHEEPASAFPSWLPLLLLPVLWAAGMKTQQITQQWRLCAGLSTASIFREL